MKDFLKQNTKKMLPEILKIKTMVVAPLRVTLLIDVLRCINIETLVFQTVCMFKSVTNHDLYH